MPKSEREKRVEASSERPTAYVQRSSGAVQKWYIENEMRDTVRLTLPEGNKKLTKEVSREEFDLLNAHGAREAMAALDALKMEERDKTIYAPSGEVQENRLVGEINKGMKEMAEGNYEGARALLLREALERSREYPGLASGRIDELKEKLSGAREALKTRLKEKEKRLEQVKGWLEQARKEGDIDRIAGLELKSVEAHTDIRALRFELEQNFGKVQFLLDAIDALDKVRKKK